jgi:hypothetical protein
MSGDFGFGDVLQMCVRRFLLRSLDFGHVLWRNHSEMIYSENMYSRGS